jgi:CIC family chloride channel protein
MGQGPDIEMTMLPPPPLTSLWLFVIFGFLFGILGVVFNFFLIRTLDFFSNLKGPAFTLTGLYVGAAIGLIAWLYPGMTGGGYKVIPEAFSRAAARRC